MNISKDKFVYFIYSNKQYKDRKAIEEKTTKVYIPGKVKTKNGYKQYTEISTKSTNNYSDAIIVHKCMLSEAIYTK